MKTDKKAWWAKAACALLLVASIIAAAWSNQQPRSSKEHRELRKQPTGSDGVIPKLSAVDDPKVLNIHVVPHTHDDVGWLKTVEEYYYGRNMTIQQACVKDVLDTAIEALMENPNRTFTYVEMKFFSMWWNEQNDATKDAVRFLIANQQLSFTNGGWCMHDEASTHYMGMIDQTTLGHDFLKKELGVIPKVGWQLDPFGHSATQASLLTQGVGFDALYFGRIDYQDLAIRRDAQECEGLWSSSRSINTTAFWGLTGSYSGNYEAPHGFCFDLRCKGIDDLLTDLNRTALLNKLSMFLDEMKVQSDRTKGNHMMITMGSDFNYQRAGVYFANNDLLIGSVQRFQQWGLVNITAIMGPRFEKINIFYSSPEYYTKAKYKETQMEKAQAAAGVDWATKTDDFFPYSDCPHCFWTGYFTSRTAFKRLERVGSSFLLAARQIEAFPENASDAYAHDCRSRCDCDKPLYELEDAMGVVQHHDAVSGTAKQHVSNDYSKRVQAGINKAAEYVANKLKRLLAEDVDGLNALDNLSYCQRINETICEVSQDATKNAGQELHVVVYQPLGSRESAIVRLPVSVDGTFDVTRIGGDPSKTASICSSPSPFGDTHSGSAPFVLSFDTGHLAPVGATVFRVTKSVESNPLNHKESMNWVDAQRNLKSLNVKDEPDEIVASNDLIAVHFDRETGAMTSVATNETSLKVAQAWGYYTSFDATIDKPADDPGGKQNSGAYIFRPSTSDQSLKTIGYLPNAAKFVNTSVGMEVHVEFAPWIKQVTRVMKGLPYVEVEYSVGPIPIDDGRGKEVVTLFSTPIKSKGKFFTDSNGREFQQRQRNVRPSWPLKVYEPEAGNYYPVNAAIYIEDEASSLSILVDRTQGGSSLSDGSVELMAQRRTLADDARGVGEPMNETDGGVTPYPPFGHNKRWGEGMIIRGSYRMMVGIGNSGASLARSEMDRAFASPLVFAASSPAPANNSRIRDTLSALKENLPPNVMLVTFKKVADDDSSYLLRLGHQYGVGDDSVLSQPLSVDLSKVFAKFKLVSADEMTLSANQRYNDWVSRRLDWAGSGRLPESKVDGADSVVTLNPMEVRSFLLQMVPN